MALPASVARLAAPFRARERGAVRLLTLVALLAALLAAGLLARVGSPALRVIAAALLLLAAGLAVLRALRDARAYRETSRALARVLGPVDRMLTERTLRAAALAERAQWDPSLGSRELAELHFERLLAKASLDAIQAAGQRRARWLRGSALALLALLCLSVAPDPRRVLEGLDVMVAQKGVAPVTMTWLELVRVSAQPPAYLRSSERPLLSILDSAEPQGSVIIVRGVPAHDGRQLVLSDGQSEVPFVADGTGGVVARYVLNQRATLGIAARFGKVLIPEAERLELDAVPDAAPVVVLEGAPRSVDLATLNRLELRYEISDDHGLREVELVLRSGKREERRSLARLDGETRLERGAYALEPRDHFLRGTFLPVEVSIEARDNDGLKPAKWGKSASITLTPAELGAQEAARYLALRAARAGLGELLAVELSPRSDAAEQKQRDAQAMQAVKDKLRSALDAHWRFSAGLSAFLSGQLRVLERPLATPASVVKRTEDTLLAVDASLRGLGNRDAATVAKRLGDAAEEAADGAHQALAAEQREAGTRRLDQALGVLDAGAKNLVVLSVLGRDLGSVAQGEIRRIRRAMAAGSLAAAELAARHLAARMRRPDPSFSAAGSGGVESGSRGGKGAPDQQASDADRKFDELVGELERLASEHQSEIEHVERALDEADKSVDLQGLKEEAQARARALRDRAEALPQFSSDSGSASSSAALGREHAESMAQSLSRLSLRDAVESGLRAKAELADAAKRSKEPNRAADYLDSQALGAAQSELEHALAFAQEALAKAQQQAAEKSGPGLEGSAGRERSFAERAGNLAGRGNHGEIALPQELSDSLEKAEALMRDASRELSGGKGSQGLALQRDAQRLLEQSNSGKSDSDGEQNDSAHGQQSKPAHDGANGKSMSTEADVPKPDSSKRADDFRRRVLEGLSREAGGRHADAIRRYTEGLLK